MYSLLYNIASGSGSYSTLKHPPRTNEAHCHCNGGVCSLRSCQTGTGWTGLSLSIGPLPIPLHPTYTVQHPGKKKGWKQRG